MTTEKMHTGGCHCGKVRYEVTLDAEHVIDCNCSICTKKGSLLAFTPAKHFKLLSGESDVTEYIWNKKRIHYFFCKHCGIHAYAIGSMGTGEKTAAINVRCLDDVDVSKLQVKHVNGRAY